MGLYCGTNLFLLLLLLLINQLLWGYNYVKSGNLSPVQFQPHLYKARWTKFMTEIERKPKTLEDLKLAVIGDVEQGAIGLTFNSRLTMRMRGPNLNSSPMTSPIGYMHVALLPLFKKKGNTPQIGNNLKW